MRLTSTAESIVVRDSDGIRVLSVGRLASSDEDASSRNSKSDDVGATKALHTSAKIAASRRQRQARREQERDTANAKQKIEEAAAAMAENQKRETSALFVSFIAYDKR